MSRSESTEGSLATCRSDIVNLYKHLMGYGKASSNTSTVDLILGMERCQEYYDLKAVRNRMETEFKKKFSNKIEIKRLTADDKTKLPSKIEYDKFTPEARVAIIGEDEYEKLCANVISTHEDWYQEEVRKRLPLRKRIRYGFEENAGMIGWTVSGTIGIATFIRSGSVATSVIVGGITEAFWKIFGSKGANRTP